MYFATTEMVKKVHLPMIEHYTRRLLSSSALHGEFCVYGN